MTRVVLIAVVLLAAALPAAAEYPERPLTIIAAYPAGGMVDIVGRPLAELMKKKYPKGVVVLNRPGGGGSVGTAEAIQAKPDGYTTVLATLSSLVIQPQVNDLPYKTPDDYEPIINLISFYPVLAVKADSPWKTVGEFLGAAKAAPGKLRVASPGETTSSHLSLEELTRRANVKITHVPFSGWGEGSPALLGGHVEAIVAQPGEVKPLVDGKKLRVLVVFQRTRHAMFPDAPTAKELGYDFAMGVWFVLTAPKGTPAPIVKYLHDATKAAMDDPGFVSLIAARGVDIDYRAGDKVRQDLWREYKEHGEILKRLGMLKK
ncbi:MAG TPA: tripartite tricarboxylate transporter substrate binding protein [Candidatus Acidoferrum sp.]|nr:tripartite tricarboxylate transporter substrate binding protein [Candidatus Acidoferrum sp.]